jgi:hypothetical protein
MAGVPMKKKNIIYRIYITPEILPAVLFSDGEIHLIVSSGLPTDVRFFAAGWEDYPHRCMYVDYLDNKSPAKEGEEVTNYELIIVTPVCSVIETGK